MTVKLLSPHVGGRILLVVADTARELGRMFVRPQEFYESPSSKFRGVYFPLSVFAKWYARRYGKGRFTYYTDYQGYNMPGEVFLDWQKAFAGSETPQEQELLVLLGALPPQFYLIGALRKDLSTIKHEISHALYHLDDDYRGRVNAWVCVYDRELRPLRQALKKIMYRDEVLEDECVSYVLFEEAWMRRAGVKTSRLKSLRAELRLIYDAKTLWAIKPRRQWAWAYPVSEG